MFVIIKKSNSFLFHFTFRWVSCVLPTMSLSEWLLDSTLYNAKHNNVPSSAVALERAAAAGQMITGIKSTTAPTEQLEATRGSLVDTKNQRKGIGRPVSTHLHSRQMAGSQTSRTDPSMNGLAHQHSNQPGVQANPDAAPTQQPVNVFGQSGAGRKLLHVMDLNDVDDAAIDLTRSLNKQAQRADQVDADQRVDGMAHVEMSFPETAFGFGNKTELPDGTATGGNAYASTLQQPRQTQEATQTALRVIARPKINSGLELDSEFNMPENQAMGKLVKAGARAVDRGVLAILSAPINAAVWLMSKAVGGAEAYGSAGSSRNSKPYSPMTDEERAELHKPLTDAERARADELVRQFVMKRDREANERRKEQEAIEAAIKMHENEKRIALETKERLEKQLDRERIDKLPTVKGPEDMQTGHQPSTLIWMRDSALPPTPQKIVNKESDMEQKAKLIEKQKETDRQTEIDRQIMIDRQIEIERQKETARQKEIERQKEVERQKDIERVDKLPTVIGPADRVTGRQPSQMIWMYDAAPPPTPYARIPFGFNAAQSAAADQTDVIIHPEASSDVVMSAYGDDPFNLLGPKYEAWMYEPASTAAQTVEPTIESTSKQDDVIIHPEATANVVMSSYGDNPFSILGISVRPDYEAWMYEPAPTAEQTVEPTIESTIEQTIEQTIEPTAEQTIEPTAFQPLPTSALRYRNITNDVVGGFRPINGTNTTNPDDTDEPEDPIDTPAPTPATTVAPTKPTGSMTWSEWQKLNPPTTRATWVDDGRDYSAQVATHTNDRVKKYLADNPNASGRQKIEARLSALHTEDKSIKSAVGSMHIDTITRHHLNEPKYYRDNINIMKSGTHPTGELSDEEKQYIDDWEKEKKLKYRTEKKNIATQDSKTYKRSELDEIVPHDEEDEDDDEYEKQKVDIGNTGYARMLLSGKTDNLVDKDRLQMLENERDKYSLFRPFLATAGTDAFEDSPEADELKQQNLMIGMARPANWPLGNLDNKFWIDNMINEGYRYADPLYPMPEIYSGGNLTDGATLYGTYLPVPARTTQTDRTYTNKRLRIR
jgi:hypothetical protein